MFGYVRGGYARVLGRFAEVLERQGVDVRLGRGARSIGPVDGDRVRVVSEDGEFEEFDHVAVTAPAPVANRICQGLSPDEYQRLAGVRYQGIVCASLLLKRGLSPYYITNITDPAFPFTAVIEMSALVDRKYFDSRALVYLPKYVAPDDPLFDKPDETIEKEFVSALQRMHPTLRTSDVVCFQVSRVRHVYAQSTLGYSERLPPTSTSIPGVHLANSAHIVNGTLNVNETLALAERTLGQLLEATPPPRVSHVRGSVNRNAA